MKTIATRCELCPKRATKLWIYHHLCDEHYNFYVEMFEDAKKAANEVFGGNQK